MIRQALLRFRTHLLQRTSRVSALCVLPSPTSVMGYGFVFVLSLVLASASQAQLTNTRIAFSTDRDGNGEIYVMNADGTNPVNLTHNAAFDYRPSWSPDGAKIAFHSTRDGNGEIYVMNADGTNPVNLTHNAAYEDGPTWSPDGTKIAFQSNRIGSGDIYIMNADGSNQTRLTISPTGTGNTDADWSPDGTKIAFTSNRDGHYEIYVINIDGTNETRLTNNPGGSLLPQWSPDGTKIAFTSNRDGNPEIYVMNADGANQTRLTNNPAVDEIPSWAPDGMKIVFSSFRDGNEEIYVMNADGTGQTRLTNNSATDNIPAWSPFPPPTFQLSATTVNAGTVTKGSSGTATFTVTNAGSGTLSVSNLTSSNTQFTASPTNFSLTGGASQIVTVTFTPTKVGWEQSTLVITHNAAGSPDTVTASGIGRVTPPTGSLTNTKIAFRSARDGNQEIYVMNADGTNPIRLTTNSASDETPAWSPDGTKIAFQSTRDGHNEVYVMNADGTGQTRLTDNVAGNRSPSWSPDGTKIVFESDRDGSGSEIYVMNADGTNQTRLTTNSVFDAISSWSWSPDGTKIAFGSTRDGNWEIYVMNADGTDQTRLTNNSVSDLLPSWSPDGTKIVFMSIPSGDNNEIYVMNADGSGQTNLTNNSASDGTPSWSPDGTKIAFESRRDGNYEIYVMNTDGTAQTRLTTNPAEDAQPAWSPFLPPTFQLSATTVNAGTVTKGASGTATFTVTNAGGDTLSVTNITSINTQFTVSPTNFSLTAGASQTVTVTFTPTKVGWEQSTLIITHNAAGSPDTVTASGIGRVTPPTGSLTNTKIAFYTNRDGNDEIYTMNTDGTSLTRLTSNSSEDYSPAWSPDGTKIAFTSERDGSGATAREICVMNADGTNVTRLTFNTAYDALPAWSPDGTKIAFTSDRDGDNDIYVMNADGTNQTRLTSNSASDAAPSWSPDGMKITFHSYRDGSNAEIYVMNADGTNQIRLTNNPAQDDRPAWSSDGTKIVYYTTRDGDGGEELHVMNADGTNSVRLTNSLGVNTEPSWSPDGTKIVFRSSRDSGNDEIYVMNVDGTNQTRLTNTGLTVNDGQPSWSPFLPSLAPDTLSFAQVFARPGSQIRVPVVLHAPTPVAGLQFRVHPTLNGSPASGLSFDHVNNVLDNPATEEEEFTVDTSVTEDGMPSVVLRSNTGNPIAGDPITILELVYNIAPNVSPGTVFHLDISDDLLSSTDAPPQAIPHTLQPGVIRVGPSLPGDLDADGRITIIDVVHEIYFILGRLPLPAPGTFDFLIADLTQDGSVDILDVVAMVNKILHNNGVPKVIAGPTGPVAVSLGDVQILTSGQSAIPVLLQADGAIAGIQAVFTFDPAQLRIGLPELVGRAAGMTLMSEVKDGTLRLVVYSATDQGIVAGNGPVLLLPITVLGGPSAAPSLALSQVVLADHQAHAVPVTLEVSTVKVSALPTAFALNPNHPNPFNPTTQIAYDIPQQAHVVLAVYNLLGQEVVRLVDESKAPGRYLVTWDGRNGQGGTVSSGVYLYRLTSSTGFSQSRRMTLLK